MTAIAPRRNMIRPSRVREGDTTRFINLNAWSGPMRSSCREAELRLILIGNRRAPSRAKDQPFTCVSTLLKTIWPANCSRQRWLELKREGKDWSREFWDPNDKEELCLKSAKTFLDRVSTTCGSGWVMDQLHKTLGNRARLRRTHPLPQVVLTRSKRDV